MKNLSPFVSALFILCLLSAANAQTPSWMWAKSAGNSGYDYSQSVAADSIGNSYVTGYFNTSITFDPGHVFFTNGSSDLYLVKYDSGGNVVWAVSSGGSDVDMATSVAVDQEGNIYLTGYYKSPTLTFGSITLTNTGGAQYDIFLVKYDSDGNVEWAKNTGGTGDDRGYSVAADDQGNVFLAAYFFSPSVTVGTTTLTNNGFSDIFIAKYTTDGNVLWVDSPVGPGWEYIYGVAVDKSGNSYIAGKLNGNTLTFGTTVLTKVANHDMFVAKYSPAGLVLWAKNAGVSGDNSSNFVAADKYGNCYAVGRFGGNNIVFGPVTLPNAGNGDVFIVKYDVAGNVVWAKSAGGSQNEEAYAVTTDRFGYIYVAGYFKSASITFGSNVLTNFNAGTADIFVTEYNQDGNVAWSLGAGGTGDEMAYSAAVDGMRNSFSAGYIGSATVVFGSTILTSNGTTDMFVAKTNNIPITGIGERDQKPVSIFPNPASDHISIFLNGIFSVEIYDNSGRLCKKIDEHSSPEIDISDLARGIYMIRVNKGDEIMTGKFIKM